MRAAPDCPTALAIVAIDIARNHLARFAEQTDSPEVRIVEAADFLDDAYAALTERQVFHEGC